MVEAGDLNSLCVGSSPTESTMYKVTYGTISGGWKSVIISYSGDFKTVNGKCNFTIYLNSLGISPTGSYTAEKV